MIKTVPDFTDKEPPMTDESAKLLAEAMNRLAAAIESVRGTSGLQPGIMVNHVGAPACNYSSYQQQFNPAYRMGGGNS